MRRILLSILFCAVATLTLAQVTGGFMTRMTVQSNCATTSCNAQSPTWCVTTVPDGLVYVCNVSTGLYVPNAAKASFDFTLAAPGQGPSVTTSASFGTCTNTNTYRLQLAWINRSGQTLLGPVSADIVPSSTNKQITVTRSESLPANADGWVVYWSKLSEGYGVRRLCTGTDPWAVARPSSVTTFDCGCVAAGGTHPGVNQTGPLPTAWMGPSGWSNDLGVSFARPMVEGGRMRYVCKTGCRYSSVAQAINEILDAASNNWYTVLIGPGDYAEIVNAKSYVSLQGFSRDATRIIGTGSGAGVAVGPNVTTSISDLTIGSQTGLNINGTNTTAPELFLNNLALGIIDGTQSVQSQDGIIDTSEGGRTTYGSNLLVRSLFDFNFTGGNNTFIGNNNTYTNSGIDTTTTLYIWNIGQLSGKHGSRTFEKNPTVLLSLPGTDNDIVTALRFVPIAGTPTGPTIVEITGGTIDPQTTNSSRTAPITVIDLGALGSTSQGSRISFIGTRISATAAGTSAAVEGLNVTSDADHSNTTVLFSGGSQTLTGGASRTDIVTAETTSGFQIGLSGWTHSGVYSGTGVGLIKPTDVRTGAFTSNLQGPSGDCCPSTCTTGQTFDDTNGTNKEWCVCTATDTWKCVTLSSAGPAD